MANQLTIPNNLPESLVVLDAATHAEVAALLDQAQAITVCDVDTLKQADALFVDVSTLAKRIADGRLEITRPIDALKKQILEVEREATGPLLAEKERLGREVTAYNRELQRQREEEERRVREENARRERERREAEEAAERERQEQEDLFGDSVGVAKSETVAPPPIIPERVATTPAPIKTSVRTSKRRVLEIVDQRAALLCLCHEVIAADRDGNPQLFAALSSALDVNKPKLKALLEMGIQITGARMAESESVRAGR